MRNPKALAAIEPVALFKTLLENPEITAMAAICEILKELPDEAARMRVMRWSFGRFGEEFKRPLPDPRPEAIPAPVQVSPPERAPRMEAAPQWQPAAPTVGEVDAQCGAPDFAREISELKDLFQPRGLVSGSFA
jgi:hypothetical protein